MKVNRMATDTRPTTKTLTLTSGKKVTIGQLKWGAYRKLRNAMAGEAIQNLMKMFWGAKAKLESTETETESPDRETDWRQMLPEIVEAFFEAMDSNSEDFIRGCVQSDELQELGPLAEVPVIDVLEIRQACGEVVDLRKVLGLEGNVLAAVMNQVEKSGITADGGLSSILNSPKGTGGDGVT